MENEEKTAQTTETEQVTETATAAAAENNEGFVDGVASEEQKAEPQTKEQNAEFARKRREAERAKSDENIRTQAIIDALGGKNPFTGEEMVDAQDVAEWQKMRELQSKGLDPVNDFRKTVKEEQRAKADEEKKQAEQRAWFVKDREDFVAEFPDVTLSGDKGLLSNEAFQTYAGANVGKVPLAQLYKQFQSIRESIRNEAVQEAARAAAAAQSTPGSLSAPAGDKSYFSYDDVKAMTPEQRKQNIDKILESRKNWK